MTALSKSKTLVFFARDAQVNQRNACLEWLSFGVLPCRLDREKLEEITRFHEDYQLDTEETAADVMEIIDRLEEEHSTLTDTVQRNNEDSAYTSVNNKQKIYSIRVGVFWEKGHNTIMLKLWLLNFRHGRFGTSAFLLVAESAG